MSFHQRHPDDRLGFLGFRKLDRAVDGGVSVCLSSWGWGSRKPSNTVVVNWKDCPLRPT